jgi:hypothetical protein
MNMPDSNGDQPRSFRTLRGFFNGCEPDEPNEFKYSATLRIHGEGVPFAELTERLSVQPTHIHRKGETRGPRSPAWRDDAWHYKPPLAETEPLECHINALWGVVRPHVVYLKSLKDRFQVDVICGYRSNCDLAGIEVPHTCLEIFTVLEVPFGLSIIVC